MQVKFTNSSSVRTRIRLWRIAGPGQRTVVCYDGDRWQLTQCRGLRIKVYYNEATSPVSHLLVERLATGRGNMRAKVNRRYFSSALILVMAVCLSTSTWSQQYRSKILIDNRDTLEKGAALSLEQLEQQLDSLTDPYARSSTTRHLARQYIEQGDYDKAIGYYEAALEAEGLSGVADREILRELASDSIHSNLNNVNNQKRPGTDGRVLRCQKIGIINPERP